MLSPHASLPLLASALAGLALAAPAAEAAPWATPTATAETAPRYGDDAGGRADADDPAIWVNPLVPSRSFVAGTLKEGGLTAFDLQGRTFRTSRLRRPRARGPSRDA